MCLTANDSHPPRHVLLDHFPEDGLLRVDESHVSTPQVRGQNKGERSRKVTLVGHGFRPPSALHDRPPRLREFELWLRTSTRLNALSLSRQPSPPKKERSWSLANGPERMSANAMTAAATKPEREVRQVAMDLHFERAVSIRDGIGEMKKCP